MPHGYRIELTEGAEETYTRLSQEAQTCLDRGDRSNSKVTLFRMVEEAIDKIIPQDPFNPRRALSGPLSNMFRVRKGRVRILYAGSSKQRRIVILHISDAPRKAGSRHDPYVVFTRLFEAGLFDNVLKQLTVRRKLKGKHRLTPPTPPPPTVH